MKIASYNMAQSAISHYARHEKESFEAELKVFKIPEESQDQTSIAEEIVKPEDELIDALMAYLDRRRFNDKVVPYIPKDLIEDTIQTQSNSIGVLSVTSSLEIFESEQLFFQSQGQVETEDGQTFDFSYDLDMNRVLYEKYSQVVNDGLMDPLVLNLDNKGVDFSDKIIRLDLDLDGQIDMFKMVTSGNGFLVLDKNENGKVDNGHELFGPQSKHGFKELSALDDDHNGWIDENDLVFKNLKIWTLDGDGMETLVDLKDYNIGAICLGNVAGEFNYKKQGTNIARITNSSIFLRDDGSASSIHEVLL